MADICAGLHYAHNITDGMGKRLNVVHRDVTPQNVLVTYDGIVKVVDFGIAKATWQASRTRPGVVKGKYAYMSPEQVEGRMLDARSDIFSVGICLYELLTGQPLYRRDNVTEAMKEIRDGKPVHPEQHRADIPSELMAVLHKALSTAKEQRYLTAAAMQLDLERYLKGATGLATPQLLGEFLRRESPPGPQGEALVEGPEGEPVVARTPTPATPPPSAPPPSSSSPSASEAAPPGEAQVGTAQLSAVKGAITPAYENSPMASSPSKNDDPTRPGKLGTGVGFADPNDDDLTRRDDREPVMSTTDHARLGDAPTVHAASVEVSLPAEPTRLDARSNEHERMRSAAEPDRARSGEQERVRSSEHPRARQTGDSLQASPLGSMPSGSQPQAQMPSEPTSAVIPKAPPRRGFLWVVVLALIAGGGVFSAQHLGLIDLKALGSGGTTHAVASPDLLAVVDAAGASSDGAANKMADTKPVTTALPVQTSATLGVYTRPTGAKVFIDGEALEALTPVRTQPVTEGPHHLVIERTGYQPRELDVVLKAGEHRTLDVELPEEQSLQPAHGKRKGAGWSRVAGNGTVTITTVPWSKVYEGGRLLGETPLVNLPLPEGAHTLTFQSPDHAAVKKKIVVHVGEDTKLKVALDSP
jgi:hypothetical protein